MLKINTNYVEIFIVFVYAFASQLKNNSYDEIER